MSKNELPLDGITVVSIEQAVAAPYCGRLLADQGARVIKVEREGTGDFARQYDERVAGDASFFVWLNRAKQSICLDLKSEDDLALLWRMIESADIFIQNLAPGAMDRLGLSKQALHVRNPKLISCSISGFGPDGPLASRKAYDLLIQAEAGLLSVTGTEETPSKVGISIADICTGVTAYHLILAALIKRGKTGLGDHLDISMLESLAEWMGAAMYYGFDGAPPQARGGGGHPTIYPYGPFPTADGTILFGLQNDREWASFCTTVLQREDLAADTRFNGNAGRAASRSIIDPVIRAVLSELTSEEATERLNKAGIANAEVRDIPGLWAHPQFAARNRWQETVNSTGTVVPLLTPPSGDGWQPVIGDVPALNAHGAMIREEFA